MSTKDEISKAIAAHERWKETLSQCIETGVCTTSPDVVKEDSNCAFGKWLISQADEMGPSPYFNNVVNLHTAFHQEAGEILKLAMCGGKRKAKERLGTTYQSVSEDLIRELLDWDASL